MTTQNTERALGDRLSAHLEYVYGPNDQWHLTCSRCGRPIYAGEPALIFEDEREEYAAALCFDHEADWPVEQIT